MNDPSAVSTVARRWRIGTSVSNALFRSYIGSWDYFGRRKVNIDAPGIWQAWRPRGEYRQQVSRLLSAAPSGKERGHSCNLCTFHLDVRLIQFWAGQLEVKSVIPLFTLPFEWSFAIRVAEKLMEVIWERKIEEIDVMASEISMLHIRKIGKEVTCDLGKAKKRVNLWMIINYRICSIGG